MSEPMLHAFNGLPGIALVPMPVESLSRQPELDDEVAGKVLRLDFPPLLSPQTNEGRFFSAHYHPGIRSPDKAAPGGRIEYPYDLSFHVTLSGSESSGSCSHQYKLVIDIALSIKTVHPITSAQCRAARALLDMTQSELAAAAHLGLSTVVDFEKSRRQVSQEAIRAMQKALEQAGITFHGGGAGPALGGLIEGLAEPPSVFKVDAHMGASRRDALLSAQIRAGRALLRWSAADLAREFCLGGEYH